MKLDPTNIQILTLLSQGVPLKDISGKVFITATAINKRLQKLRKRNNCKSTTALVVKAFSENLISAPE